MPEENKPPAYEQVDPTIAVEYLMDVVRTVAHLHGWPHLVKYALRPWCENLYGALSEAGVRLAVRQKTVALKPAPAQRKEWPVRVVDVRWNKPVSTPELRAHAFAAYASAYALYGKDAAFEAAVNETLRRERTWGEGTCADHTRRFVVPAYRRAFPKAFEGDEKPEPPRPGAPIAAKPRRVA